MASNDELIQKSVDGAFEDIKKFAPDQFAQLEASPSKKAEITKAARDIAAEHLKLVEEFRTRTPTENVAEHLAKHLSKQRLGLIETGLQVPTYSLNISKKADGHHWVDITRDGKEFMPSKKLTTVAAIDSTSWIQIASIIVEAVLLVLQAVGIKVAVSESAIAKTAEEIIPVIESSSQLQKAVQALKEAAQGGSKWEIAKAIFQLIKDSYSASILWKIIKGLCSNMSKWDWIKTAGIVTTMIIAAIATDGVALIAKIVLALNSAYEFIKKLTNLGELEALKQNLSA